MCGFNSVQRGDYFGGGPIKRNEVEGRESLRTEKDAGKNEVTK